MERFAKKNDPTVARFQNLFSGYTQRYGTFEILKGQDKGKQKGNAKTRPGPLKESAYVDHLNGKEGLGVIPLWDDDESASFGCIDIDKYPMDFDALEKDCQELPVMITKSKSGGAHVWLFTKQPVPALLIQRVLRVWAAELGFGKSEIFPKQVRRASEHDAGNWINLPFFGGTRLGYFDGANQLIEEFLTKAERRLMNATTLEAFMKATDEKPLFHDGPPCLATITEKGIGPGTRNMVLLNVGSYLKRKDPANFLLNLVNFNKTYLADPLSETEITTTIAKSLQRKTYAYQCNQEPLCSACNRSTCIKREFGVGGSEELTLTLTGLTKVATDPPIWYINIEGVRVEFDDFDTLLQQNKFRLLAAETVHEIPTRIKSTAWEKIVNELLATVEVLDAPEEASIRGQVGEEIKDFIQQFSQSDGMDQVLSHTVYVDEDRGRAFFVASDLIRRIKRNMGNAVSSQKVWAYFRYRPDLEVISQEVKLKDGSEIKVWSINVVALGLMKRKLAIPTELSAPEASVPF